MRVPAVPEVVELGIVDEPPVDEGIGQFRGEGYVVRGSFFVEDVRAAKADDDPREAVLDRVIVAKALDGEALEPEGKVISEKPEGFSERDDLAAEGDELGIPEALFLDTASPCLELGLIGREFRRIGKESLRFGKKLPFARESVGERGFQRCLCFWCHTDIEYTRYTVKILIVSDIHANLDAFQAVLAQERGAYEGFLCLGDTTGYGCDPAECVALVRAAAHEAALSLVLTGNHDAVLSGRVDSSWFNASALRSVGFTRMRLGSEALDWLAALPASGDVLIPSGNGKGEPILAAIAAHGSADEPLTGYLWGGEETVETYAAMASRAVPLCLVGHTHVASVFSYGGYGAVSPRGVLSVGGSPVIVNPGSVGFPREFGLFADVIDESGGSSPEIPEPEPLSIERYPAYYALWDTEARAVSFRDARYDRGPFDRRLAAAGL